MSTEGLVSQDDGVSRESRVSTGDIVAPEDAASPRDHATPDHAMSPEDHLSTDDLAGPKSRVAPEDTVSPQDRANPDHATSPAGRVSPNDAVPREAKAPVGTPGAPRFAPEWLLLREGADAAARAKDLLGPLRHRLTAAARVPGRRPLLVRDLGCGTGSMGRWLVGRLPGPQRWVLHDRDPVLLARARTGLPGAAADGTPVTASTHTGDLTRLRGADLAGTALVTASALLDLLTADEVDGLAAACVAAACPALLTLSVTGRVALSPADPLDAAIGAAFNAHQRRATAGRRLLGPDAVASAVGAFRRRGAEVRVRPSPWRLGPERAALTAEWLVGWVAAAVEQCPELAGRADDYLGRRLEACAAGGLAVVVQHADLLSLPAAPGGET